MDQMNLSAWESRTETRQGGLSAQQAAMSQATFCGAQQQLHPGDPMPPLWHWFAFLPSTPTGELGRDGHPPLGDFLPPVRLERRMWAGGSLSFHAALHVGEALTRRSVIRKVVEKEGAAGAMVFVTVDHEISGEAGLAIREQQDIVYLAIGDRFQPPRRQDVPVDPVFATAYETTPPLLFRYSALTFNAHRIHYDVPYAQEIEHSPGLVVHGPSQANLLIDAATRHAGRCPDQFSFRGVHPVFVGQELHLIGAQADDQGLTLCTAVTEDGAQYQGMQAKAIWEDQI